MAGFSRLFSRNQAPPADKTEKEATILDPEIAKLQNRLDELNHSIQTTGARVATSTVSTSIGVAHMGIEIAKLAVGESMALATAGSGLLIGGGVIGLALSAKGIYDNTRTLLQAKQELQTTDDPALKEKLEEKITGAKVGITRGALSAAASSLGIAASGMGIAATVGVAGLSTAVAATGFGALAIAGVALLLGIAYLVYRNREAIAHFFANAAETLSKMMNNLAQGARTSLDQASSKIMNRLDEIEKSMKIRHEQQLISSSGQTSAESTRKALEAAEEKAKERERTLHNLKLMFTAAAG
jgi:hypothetical protein